jgi:methanogenic corrinoid protein MtbC1
MNDQGSFTAALLDASRKAYAAGAVLRMQELSDECARLVELLGFSSLVDDAQLRLQHLAESLACGRPELFVLDTEWEAATHIARGVPEPVLRSLLSCLMEELNDNLPAGSLFAAREHLELALDRISQPIAAPRSLLAKPAPHAELATEFLLAILQGRRDKAESAIFGALDRGVSVDDLHMHVISRAQAELGRMWQVGEIHVAEEHFGSRIVEDLLSQLRARMPRNPDKTKTVLSASVSGNLHDIGLRIVADHFEMDGWRSIFLGANMPIRDFVQAMRDFEPDLIALSAGLAINVRATAAAIDALRMEKEDCKILVGGRAFTLVTGLWRDVGADACASDAVDAVRQGNRLMADA